MCHCLLLHAYRQLQALTLLISLQPESISPVKGENTGDNVGPGIQTQDLSDESLAPYRSELSGQPNHSLTSTKKEKKRNLSLIMKYIRIRKPTTRWRSSRSCHHPVIFADKLKTKSTNFMYSKNIIGKKTAMPGIG